MYSHYLLTRFNVVHQGLNQYALEQRGSVVQTEQWLSCRFDLFDKYCFPSVNQQSNKNFTWLVFFNTETPEKYKSKIQEYAKRCPMFRPIYVEPEGDETQKAIQYIKKDTSSKYVITTRLDNDDMIHRDLIKYISAHCPLPRTTYTDVNIFLCFRWGYQYDTQRKILLKHADDFNHFESRLETIDNLQTVWVKNDRHDLVNLYGDIQIISPIDVSNKQYPGMWIEVIHNCNVTNNTGKGKPMWIRKEHFSKQLKINPFMQLLYQLRHSFTQRFIR